MWQRDHAEGVGKAPETGVPGFPGPRVLTRVPVRGGMGAGSERQEGVALPT